MIEVQLSVLTMLKTIAVFAEHVVEFLFCELKGGSRRVHVGHVKSVEVAPVARAKEKYSLAIKGEY